MSRSLIGAALPAGRKMESPAESVDEVAWSHLSGMIGAAHRLDHADYVARARALGAESLARQQRAGLYVWFLLRNAVGEVIEWRVPSDEDLERVARDHARGFRILTGGDAKALENVLRQAWRRSQREKKLTPGEMLVVGGAAIGLLCHDAGGSLNRMKPQLDEWWRKHAGDYLKGGLIPQ